MLEELEEKRRSEQDERGDDDYGGSTVSTKANNDAVSARLLHLQKQLLLAKERIAQLEAMSAKKDAHNAELAEQVSFLERALLGDEAVQALTSAGRLVGGAALRYRAGGVGADAIKGGRKEGTGVRGIEDADKMARKGGEATARRSEAVQSRKK